jgi:hypothetical protein
VGPELIVIRSVLDIAYTKTNIKKIDWGSRIGTYTYEEALAEMGEPNVMGESSEGKIAEWVLQRSPNVSFGLNKLVGRSCRACLEVLKTNNRCHP